MRVSLTPPTTASTPIRLAFSHNQAVVQAWCPPDVELKVVKFRKELTTIWHISLDIINKTASPELIKEILKKVKLFSRKYNFLFNRVTTKNIIIYGHYTNDY